MRMIVGSFRWRKTLSKTHLFHKSFPP